MGLDMYAYRVKQELLGDAQVDLEELLFEEGQTKDGVDREFAYWRKFNALHGWMHALYERKGGKDEEFNCNTVRLNEEDLDTLEAEVDSLVPVSGFFFGPTDPVTEEEKQEVRYFITKSREAIAEGDAVIYDSWW